MMIKLIFMFFVSLGVAWIISMGGLYIIELFIDLPMAAHFLLSALVGAICVSIGTTQAYMNMIYR